MWTSARKASRSAAVMERDISTLRAVVRRAFAPLLVHPAQVTPLAGPGVAPGLVHPRVPAARAARLGHARCFASAVVGTPAPLDADPFDAASSVPSASWAMAARTSSGTAG